MVAMGIDMRAEYRERQMPGMLDATTADGQPSEGKREDDDGSRRHGTCAAP
jgi:hypothetical protein